jgi:hypothetical protein
VNDGCGYDRATEFMFLEDEDDDANDIQITSYNKSRSNNNNDGNKGNNIVGTTQAVAAGSVNVPAIQSNTKTTVEQRGAGRETNLLLPNSARL